MSKVHVIVPDSHAHPDYSNSRFRLAGQFIADIRPDVVINLGDWYDMPSLSSYDKGTKSFEGRRLRNDLAAGTAALDMFMSPIRARKKKLPRFIALQGNHEYRLNKAIEYNAALLDGVKTDFSFPDYGFEWVPYNGATPGVINVDGILYSHYITRGGTDRALSSIHQAASLLSQSMVSVVVGHKHTLDFSRKVRMDGIPIQSICAGWWGDFSPSFAGNGVDHWWSGITVLYNVENGQFDPEFVSMKRLKEVYG